MGMPEDIEEEPGGLIPVNNDFDEQNTWNGENVPDNHPDEDVGHRIAPGDGELRDATLYVSGPYTSGTWTITYNSDKIYLWEWRDDEYVLVPSGYSRYEPSLPAAIAFKVEGIDHSAALRDVTITARATGGSASETSGGDESSGPEQNNTDSAKLTVVAVDGDVDSDNDNGLEHPERDDHEEHLEDQPAELGKLLSVNNGDADGDDIPDFADGYDLDRDGLGDDRFSPQSRFVRYVLDLSGVAFSSEAWSSSATPPRTRPCTTLRSRTAPTGSDARICVRRSFRVSAMSSCWCSSAH